MLVQLVSGELGCLHRSSRQGIGPYRQSEYRTQKVNNGFMTCAFLISAARAGHEARAPLGTPTAASIARIAGGQAVAAG